MSQRVETSAPALVLTRSSQPENGHLRKNILSQEIHLLTLELNMFSKYTCLLYL